MALTLTGIHFLVTYRCTYSCRHCFVFGSPDHEGALTLGQMVRVIDEGVALGVDTVYFEGGEPTLHWPLVLAAAAHARERGLDWGLVTNCYWAESREDAMLWLEPLQRLGISDLSLSSYAYFSEAEHLEERLLRNAVEAAHKLGLPMSVLEVGAEAALGVPGVCTGDVGDIMYKGRAAVELAAERAALHGRPPQTFTECPHEDFDDPGRAHLGPDGQLQLCQGVSAGDVFADGLAGVLRSYDADALPVIRELRRGGPWALAAAYKLTPARERYADACHLCFELRSALRPRFPAVLAPAQCYQQGGGADEA
jgi:hypothetical protein